MIIGLQLGDLYVGLASRFGDSVFADAGKGQFGGGGEVDAVADGDEQGFNGVAGAKGEADFFFAVHEGGGGAGFSGGVFEPSDESAFGDAYAGAVEEDGDMGGESAARGWA